ncbi:MAG: TldD/PmbA family protein [Lachnospiraceae bacterium]|nr:TldD/PmbA family protein [Lachnospiraceae bacterium]
MSEIRNTADIMDAILAGQSVAKYTYTLVESEKQELNVENGNLKLMRTVFNNSCSLSVFDGSKKGAVNGNDITPEGLKKLVANGKVAAESADEDPCNDFAPDQGKDVFRYGVYEPDLDGFIERVKEFLAAVAKEYPKVNLLNVVASFDRWNWLSRNTNGTEFEGFGGKYGFNIEISASEGDTTTGLDYTGISMKDLNTPFIDLPGIRMHLENVQNSIHPETLEGKFTGPVVFLPECAAEFIFTTLYNYTDSDVIIDGTSQWLDKVGEKVAHESLTVSIKSSDERIVCGERATQDGFRTEDATIIDHGVLKAHMLNLYAANKTGRPVLKNTSGDLVVEPGDKTVEELIGSIDKGLLLGGFSGGQPGANGEFSGVAKNSFLIENGKIKCAVTETMVNGNLGEIVRNIRGISKEQYCDGGFVVPYIAVDGIVISGK